MCLTWRPRCSRFQNLLYRGFLTRKRFAASKASELATVLPIENRRYGRFGNPALRPKGAKQVHGNSVRLSRFSLISFNTDNGPACTGPPPVSPNERRDPAFRSPWL